MGMRWNIQQVGLIRRGEGFKLDKKLKQSTQGMTHQEVQLDSVADLL